MKLKRGINFGGWLSQCKSYTLEHYRSFLHEEDVQQLAAWGFDHVRVPIDYEVLQHEDGSEFPEGVALVDALVDWCERAGLNVILDLHKAPGYDFNNAGDAEKNNLFSSPALQARFLTLWGWMARRYGGRSHVALELLNEVAEAENAAPWDELIRRTLAEIRRYAPDCPVIYGGIQWNSARTLKLLTPPTDKNVIYTFHMYEPIVFTHQKAYWMPQLPQDKEMAYPDTMEAYRERSAFAGVQGQSAMEAKEERMGKPFLRAAVQEAVDAARAAGVPVYCGEFGVIDQAPPADSLRWLEDVMAVFAEMDIGFALWTYKDIDFGINEPHYDSIRADMLRLLTGKEN